MLVHETTLECFSGLESYCPLLCVQMFEALSSMISGFVRSPSGTSGQRAIKVTLRLFLKFVAFENCTIQCPSTCVHAIQELFAVSSWLPHILLQ